MSYLIKDTTEEQRRKIVEESLGNLDGACDGCAARVAEMYDASLHSRRKQQGQSLLSGITLIHITKNQIRYNHCTKNYYRHETYKGQQHQGFSVYSSSR